MEERRTGPKRAFVVAWLLTLAFVLAVGPFGKSASTEECGSGASCAPTRAEMRKDRLEARERKDRPSATAEIPKERLRVQEWRGKQPDICFAKGCEDRTPTFCMVARKLSLAEGGLKVPKHRDPCRSETRFRTARTRV